jgi:periplasmic protein CpxP/Spy
MKARISFISVIVLFFLSSSINAQPGQRVRRTPEQTAKAQLEWMKTDLKLDEAAQKKVYEVVLKYSKKSMEERQKLMTSGDRQGIRAKITEINSERDKELKPILGDKKFELFKKKEAERRTEMRQRRQN